MSVFLGGILAVGTADNIRKGIQNCGRMEIERKIIYELRQTKYMVINTGNEPEEAIEEIVKVGIAQKAAIYKNPEMVINKSGNLKDHTLELNRKFKVIKREVSITYLIPALLYGLEAWGKIGKDVMNKIGKVKGWALKWIFKLPALP